MTQYVALIAGRVGAYDVSFPDCPGCIAHGRTVNEAQRHASTELGRWLRDRDASRLVRPVARSQATMLSDFKLTDALADGALMVTVGARTLQEVPRHRAPSARN